MTENNNEELIKKLSESRENINQLFNLLKREQRDMEYQLRLAGEAKRTLNDVLFGLTGNEFYNNNAQELKYDIK